MIYFLCPFHRTGGPENMHLLCSMLNENADDVVSMIMYLSAHPPNAKLYPEIGHVHTGYVHQINDIPTNIVVIPEIYCVRRLRKELRIQHCQYVVWWQSYVHACINYTLGNWSLPDVWHAFHSYYQYAMVRPQLSKGMEWFFLTDFIAEEYTSFDASLVMDAKEDVVCFNGHKDKITASICDQHNIPYVEIKNMSRDEVINTLKRCKVYVDMGTHPGKDHMPREAAMMGCIVITNKAGSAAYWEDVPILEKVSYETEIPTLVHKAFGAYHEMYRHQGQYRQKILDEKLHARQTAQDFISRAEEHARKYECMTFASYEAYRRFKTYYRSFLKTFQTSPGFASMTNEQKERFSKNGDALDQHDETIDLLNVMTFATSAPRTTIITHDQDDTFEALKNILALLFSTPHVRVHHLHFVSSPSPFSDDIFDYVRKVFPDRYAYASLSSQECLATLDEENENACVYIACDSVAEEFVDSLKTLLSSASCIMLRKSSKVYHQQTEANRFRELRLRCCEERSSLVCLCSE